MDERIINPRDGIYPATADYVHALEVSGVSRQLFASGTMGLDRNAVPAETLEEQLDLIWSNLRCILAAADMTTGNIVRVTSYLTSRDQISKNQEARKKALGTRRVPTTAIVVETLLPGWLVEVEIIAAA